MGPLANDRQLETVVGFIDRAVEGGATVATANSPAARSVRPAATRRATLAAGFGRPGSRSVSSGRPSIRRRARRRTMSRNRLVVMRCSQPSNVPGL